MLPKTYFFEAAVVLLSFLNLAGCSMPGVSPSSSTTSGGGSTSAALIVQSFPVQADGSFLFSTNDSASKGNTYVQYTSVPTSGAFTYTVTVSKGSGQAGGGFGLIFQRQSDGSLGPNLWLADIDSQGNYLIEKISNGAVYFVTGNSLTTWNSNTSALITGYGATNKLTVTFDGTKNYSFIANGTTLQSFTDTQMGTVYTSGNLGLDVGVLSTENFPSQEVSVSFTVTSPTGLSW